MGLRFNREGRSLLSVESMLRTFLGCFDLRDDWLALILIIVKYF
jgi:hypothetical protein